MGAFETIVACITGPVWGQGAVAGVRVSGPDAHTIAQAVFPSLPASPEPRRALYGVFKHGDDGLALPFEGEASYTGEPAVEFFVHGSPASVELLIEGCLAAGARLAEPGEFTLRAFLNGKLDLAQAEAVSDLVAARTERHLRAAQGQRRGALGKAISAALEPLMSAIVGLEAWLDFSEEIGDLDPNQLRAQLQQSLALVSHAVDQGAGSEAVRDGIRVALVGKPNAGKSSLFNFLVQADRAIVTPIPGTTRDVLEQTFIHQGILFRLMDTAGLRESEDSIEILGMERTRKAAEEADLTLYLYENEPEPEWTDRPNTRLVQTKADIIKMGSGDLSISVVTGQGMPELLNWLANQTPSLTPPYLLNSRHRALLNEATAELEFSLESISAGEPADLTLAPLRAAERALRQIVGIAEGATHDRETAGRSGNVDILDAIFSRFCIGK